MTINEKNSKYDYAILIASDTRSTGEKQDKCIGTIKEVMPEHYNAAFETIVPDDIDALQQAMLSVCDRTAIPLLLTSGGTGLSNRDNTPEATLAILDKQTPGISEAIRLASREKTAHWMLSRAVSGIRNSTLIINLPGSPKAVNESIEAILPALDHALEIMLGEVTQHN